jgi:TolA-binding protein
MLRLRFTSGLALGLVLGVPLGALIALLLTPPAPSDTATATSLQVLELTRKLQVANEARERMERQLQQFAGLAEQMTASFNSLEMRFKALEEMQRAGDNHPPPPAQTPAGSTPPGPAGSAAAAPEAAASQVGAVVAQPPAAGPTTP